MVDRTKRLIFVSALAFSIMTAGVYGASQAFAQDSDTHTTLVQMIAQKFSLKTSDVQAVFDQAREERKEKMRQLYEQRLSDAVSAGKLTLAQKQLLLKKHEELIAEHEKEFSSKERLAPEERRAEREKERSELEKWARENGIDIQYVLFGFGRGGMHMGMGRGMRADFR